MNAATRTLMTRQYAEVVDDVLTAIVGGVVNEEILFDVAIDLFPLSQTARAVRSIIGARDGQNTPFKIGVDFAFDADHNGVVWLRGGSHPDDETSFFVDYYLPTSSSPLTDINVGSVTRTLAEAISRGIAVVFQQVFVAYQSGFVDTASGRSLDLVVAILDITRKRKDFASGLVTFFRDPAADGTITIGAGTELRTADGAATFETTEQRTLQRGQVRIDVPVRATAASRGPAGNAGPGSITTLAQRIAGIDRVTNVEPTLLGAADETDDQLRARARAALRGLGRATLLALERAIFEDRSTLTEAWDPNGPPDKRSDPGTVTLLVDTEPVRFASLQAAIDDTRAAGVLATVVARYVFVRPRLVLAVSGALPGAGADKVAGEAVAAMQGYLDTLKAGDPARGEELIKAIKDGVKTTPVGAVRITDVRVDRADIGQPGPEATVDALLAAVAGSPAGDAGALRTAITNVLENAPTTLPSSRRVPDRSLLAGPDGGSPTDDQVEAGKFQVLSSGPPSLGGQQWRIALDVQPGDVTLVGS